MTEAEREKISSYEDAFEKIKEETGVNSMNVKSNTNYYLFCFFSVLFNKNKKLIK